MSRSLKILGLSVGDGINFILSFFFVPYISRALTVSDYGTYGQVLLIGGFLTTFLGFGFSKILYAELAKKENIKNNVLFSNLFLAFIFGLFGTLILLIFSFIISKSFSNPELLKLLYIYALAIPFQLLYTSLNSVLIFYGKIKKSVNVNVFSNLLRYVLIIISIQIFNSLVLVIYSLVIVYFMQFFLAYLSIPNFLQSGKISKISILTQLKTGIPLGLTVIISTIFYTIDGIMVSALLNKEQYALFKNGAIYIPMISSVFGAVNSIILPDIAKYYSDNKISLITELKKRALQNTSALIYPVVLFAITFSFVLIPLYLSDKYENSYLVFSLFNSVLFFRVMSYDDIYIISSKTNKLPKKYIIATILNIILNYILITYWGINGAALATLISIGVLVVILFTGGLKILKIKFSDIVNAKKQFYIFIVSTISVGILLVIYNLINEPIILLLFFIIHMILCYHIFLKNWILDPRILYSVVEKFDKKKIISGFIKKYYFFNKNSFDQKFNDD